MTARPGTTEPLAELLTATAAKALSADAAVLWMVDEAGASLVFTAGHGLSASSTALVAQDSAAPRERGIIPLSASRFFRDALADGCTLVEDATDDPRHVELPPGFAAALCVSLGAAADSTRPRPEASPGVLCVYQAQPRKFTDPEVELLRTIADLGAASLTVPAPLLLAAPSSVEEDLKLRSEQMEPAETEQLRLAQVTTHQLRSPITIAQSLLRTLVKGYAGPLTELQRDVLDRVGAQLDYLSHLVNDFLDLAATKAPEFAGREGPVVVNASVARVVLVLQPRAEEKQVTLTLRPHRDELVVWASEEGLDHIFHNLVENAVKYTPSGGRVTVSLARSSTDSQGVESGAAGRVGEGEAQVTITDSGIGIPEEAKQHLFEEFYRAPNARAYEAVGTGLGLAIVKGLVDRYHGRIAVETSVGQGTMFTISIPLHEAIPPRSV